ncbi:MAG: LysM peptidoglycan-binding domain-containing protein [Candidatus Obscuribacterales bacterium]|nr:LysM peptidoglycan-binding domain-containing protein [Candidatus Obscuribacterales bacterium]
MPNEFAGSLPFKLERELLSPRIDPATDALNNYVNTQFDVVRDGLWKGVSDRKVQAQENLLSTGVEVASSALIGAGLVKAFASGGKIKLGAEIVGAALGAATSFDIYRRGAAISDVYSKTNGDVLGNVERKDAIAKYAGAGIFDYSLIMASAGVGAVAGLHPYSNISLKDSFAAKPDKVLQRIGDLEKGQLPLDKIVDEKSKPPLSRLLDVEKVSDDLAYTLDYQISETAMSKISEVLQKANHEDFNAILKKLEEKDRKYQGMDLLLDNWSEKDQRWDAVKLHYTDETMVTHLIVQKGDTAATIADKETSVNPRRTDRDIKYYMEALINKNNLSDPNALNPGQILVLPFPS